MMLDDLVPEYPQVPDIYPGVLRNWTWQLRAEMQGQRPCERERDQHVAAENGYVPRGSCGNSDGFRCLRLGQFRLRANGRA